MEEFFEVVLSQLLDTRIIFFKVSPHSSLKGDRYLSYVRTLTLEKFLA